MVFSFPHNVTQSFLARLNFVVILFCQHFNIFIKTNKYYLIHKGWLKMRNKIQFSVLAAIFLLVNLSASFAQNKFTVDLNKRADDLFHVTLIPEKLTEKNKIYQFASTAPGTYQTMDIGRFVRSFKAFDRNGTEIGTKQLSTNQWEISEPLKTAKIEYNIAETWDNPVKQNAIYPMCGTSLEEDHAFINGQCVFGYFHGKQKSQIKIKLLYPEKWIIGTALDKGADGFYTAKDFDQVVDSPIQLGNLTKTSTKVENTIVNVYCYSKTGKVDADKILAAVKDIFPATSKFAQGIPAKRYDFLFHFEGQSPMSGAWEHNVSSTYVFSDLSLTPNIAKDIRSTASHEFYHIITPLNIHSELIGTFNFEKPTMSQHIWFYEGITEWAAQILQMRGNIMTLEEYLADIRQKLNNNDGYDQTISLVELSLTSTERQNQYPNIYAKGAVTGTLLDIDILSLSKGKKGLREVINKLYRDYGVNKSFSEKGFFDEFTKRTFPEIKDFINRYIKGIEKLPVQEYFAKLGIEYKEIAGYDSTRVTPGIGIGLKDNKFVVTQVDNPTGDSVQPNDIIVKLNGEEITMQNINVKFGATRRLKVGEPFKLTVDRNGTQKEITVYMQPRAIKHQFKVMKDATKEQLALRDAWMKNL